MPKYVGPRKSRESVRNYGARGNFVRSSHTKLKDAARRAAAGRLQKAWRARKKPNAAKNARTAYSNARGVKQNALAIAKLKQQIYGPLQSMSSHTDHEIPLRYNQPWGFQINNPHANGSFGPNFWCSGVDGIMQTIGHYGFNPVLPHQHGYKAEWDNRCSGPKALLVSVDLHFRFHGFVKNTNVRIMVVRQKSGGAYDPWGRLNSATTAGAGNSNGTPMWLPNCIGEFRGLAGWSPHFIDKKRYQVIADRRVYMDSRGVASESLGSLDVPTVTMENAVNPPTTGHVKYLRLNLKLNKPIKQLQPALDFNNGDDVLNANFTNAHGASQEAGGWEFGNQHPAANLWCIIDTDEAPGEFSNSHLRMDVQRRVTWRDRV